MSTHPSDDDDGEYAEGEGGSGSEGEYADGESEAGSGMDPDHPLLARAQAALKKQLANTRQELDEKIREKSEELNVRHPPSRGARSTDPRNPLWTHHPFWFLVFGASCRVLSGRGRGTERVPVHVLCVAVGWYVASRRDVRGSRRASRDPAP
jgi:hypothetical protein